MLLQKEQQQQWKQQSTSGRDCHVANIARLTEVTTKTKQQGLLPCPIPSASSWWTTHVENLCVPCQSTTTQENLDLFLALVCQNIWPCEGLGGEWHMEQVRLKQMHLFKTMLGFSSPMQCSSRLSHRSSLPRTQDRLCFTFSPRGEQIEDELWWTRFLGTLPSELNVAWTGLPTTCDLDCVTAMPDFLQFVRGFPPPLYSTFIQECDSLASFWSWLCADHVTLKARVLLILRCFSHIGDCCKTVLHLFWWLVKVHNFIILIRCLITSFWKFIFYYE